MVQIIQEKKKPKGPSVGEQLSANLPNVLNLVAQMQEQQKQVQMQQQQQEAIKQFAPELAGLPPDVQKLGLAEKFKQQSKSAEMAEQLKGNKAIIADIEKERGYEPGSLKAYEHNPAMAERVTRQPKKTQASQPIDPEQMKLIEEVRSSPGYDDMDEVQQYRSLTRSGVSKENAETESKLTGQQLERKQKGFESSYKAQEDFINDTTSSYKGFETEMKPRLMQMQHMKAEDLISPTAAVFLETMKIPLGALEDPSSELYQKLSQDLLKGLPETYGNRILKVEVDNFLKTIPQLTNSPDGRRMIASNMLKLGEMKEVYYNEMRRMQKDSLDTGKNLPKDFQQRIFDQVKPQIDRINNEFVKMSEVKSVPPGTIPFFDPNGDIVFVPEENVEWASTKGGGRRIW